jgi:sterol 3beta-glucosyltransferase
MSEQHQQQQRRRITIVSIGSRGDVQPYCVLGHALSERGHDVTIATEQRLESLVTTEFQLPFRRIIGDSTGGLFDPKYQEGLAKGSIFTLIKMTNEWKAKFDMDDILASYITALEGAEIVISGGLSMTQSYCVAEKMGVTWLPFILGPTMPTSEFPCWATAKLTFGFSCLNKWSYNFLFRQLWKDESKRINPWRQNVLTLPPITDAPLGIADLVNRNPTIPVLIAASPVVCGPKQQIPSDYDTKKIHLLGFVFAKAQPLPENVEAFLSNTNADKPAIYMGFGSMPTANPMALLRLAIDVCRALQCRAIVVAGWTCLSSDECQSLLKENAQTILVVGSVSHTTLFPRMAAIIHHGGIGTTAAALRSGVPQLPCPVMLDQPHNAAMLKRLGVAPTSVPFASITASKVIKGLELILQNDANGGNLIRARAKEVGQRISKESEISLIKACDVIESISLTSWVKE